jgi:hypothetical protein
MRKPGLPSPPTAFSRGAVDVPPPPSGLENLRWLATDQLADAHSHWREPETLDEDGLAYLQ